jgi:hypothetical protein
MKKQVVKTLTQIGLLAVIATVAAIGSAQGQPLAYRIRVNIPFAFLVADKKLPAGEYLIGRALDSGDSVLLIRSEEGRVNALRPTSPIETLAPKDARTAAEATVVFHRYGDQFFLSEVWPPGATEGRMLTESRSEREAKARTLTGNMAINAETVTVVRGPQ